MLASNTESSESPPSAKVEQVTTNLRDPWPKKYQVCLSRELFWSFSQMARTPLSPLDVANGPSLTIRALVILAFTTRKLAAAYSSTEPENASSTKFMFGAKPWTAGPTAI